MATSEPSGSSIGSTYGPERSTESMEQAASREVHAKDPVPMTDKHKQIIITNFEKLIKMNPTAVLDSLLTKEIFAVEEREDMESKPETERARQLLCRLIKKQDKGFDVLIGALKKSRSPELAMLLETADREDEEREEEDMKKELRENLCKRLKEWGSVLDDCSRDVSQPITAMSITRTVNKENSDVEELSHRVEASNMDEVLERSSSKNPIVVYGEAGMGKTTVVRHIAHSWLEEKSTIFLGRFDYVFLIPLRSARSHTLVDVICDDVKLVARNYKGALERVLATSSSVLFLLDSFEELRHSIEDIVKLIKREVQPNSVVLVTSRPEHGLDDILENLNPSTCYVEVQLQDLTDEDVKSYIQVYFRNMKQENDQFDLILQMFDMKFLKRPINLSLVCYLYKYLNVEKVGAQNISQTKLFNEMVKHFLHEYLKKQHTLDTCEEAMDPLSLLQNKGRTLSGPKSTFMDICKECYKAKRARQQSVKTPNYLCFIEFGLFTKGDEEISVDVPHLLILEFFAALHLVANSEAFTELLNEFKCNTGTGNHLPDQIHSLGLENVIKFVVALSRSPDAGLQLFESVWMKRRRTRLGFHYYDYSLALEILQECTNDNVKSAITKGLLKEAVKRYRRPGQYKHHRGVEQLLDIFTDEESRKFLELVYNCEVKDKDGHIPMLAQRKKRDDDRGTDGFYCDNFVVQSLLKFGCTVMVEHESYRAIDVLHSQLCSRALRILTHGATQHLRIRHCEVCLDLEVERSNGRLGGVSQTLPASHHVAHAARLHAQDPAQPSPHTSLTVSIWSSQVSLNAMLFFTSSVYDKIHLNDCTLVCEQDRLPNESEYRAGSASKPVHVSVELQHVRLKGLQRARDLKVTMPWVRSLKLTKCGSARAGLLELFPNAKNLLIA